jgi:MFS family permease
LNNSINKNIVLILVAQTVVMAAFSPVAGKLSDKIKPRVVASAGMAFTTSGLLLLI